LTIVLGLALVLMLAHVLVGQAPAKGRGAPGQGAPGGGRGGRGGGPAGPAGPVVRTPDGKPDFTGYWMAATKTNINNGRGGILNPDKKNDDGTFANEGKIPYNHKGE